MTCVCTKLACVRTKTSRWLCIISGWRLRLDDERRYSLIAQINHAFTPGTPINSRDLFAGRRREVEKAIGVVMQPGQHAVIYGDRGVGKTSLANTLFDFLVVFGKFNYQRARVNCAEGMSFETIWRSIFKQLILKIDGAEVNAFLPSNPHSENIRETCELLDGPAIVIIDELDRLADPIVKRALADTVKTLSDNDIDCTIIMVGVADSLDQLIVEHRSIERSIRQIEMRPMTKSELIEIVDKGLRQCDDLAISPEVKERIADYSQGLPPVAHMLSREAALVTVRSDRTYIIMPDLESAIKEAVDHQLESLLEAYRVAVTAPRGKNFKPVLLACALAPKDEQGFFYATNVTGPLQFITHTAYKIPAFARHLKSFSSATRGPILEKRGRLYRFVNPMMEPYVILRGIADGLIAEPQLSRPETTSTEPQQLSLLFPSAVPAIKI